MVEWLNDSKIVSENETIRRGVLGRNTVVARGIEYFRYMTGVLFCAERQINHRRPEEQLQIHRRRSADRHLVQSHLHSAAEMVQLDIDLDVVVGNRGPVGFRYVHHKYRIRLIIALVRHLLRAHKKRLSKTLSTHFVDVGTWPFPGL